MPISGQELLNCVCEKTTKAPIIGAVTKNPFYTAILISVILVIVILIVFRNIDFEGEKDSLPRLALRSGIYSLGAVTAIQFLQNQNVINEMKSKQTSKHMEDVFNTSGTEMHKERVGISASSSITGGHNKDDDDDDTDGGAETPLVDARSTYDGGEDVFVPVGINVDFL